MLRAEIDLAALPHATPARVKQLLARCLDRDPRTRLRDAGEARIVLAAPGPASDGDAEPTTRGRRGMPAVVAAAALALLAGLALGRVLLAPRGSEPEPALAFEIRPPSGRLRPDAAALSPDGSHLVFAVRNRDGETELWLRPLDALEARPLPGTAGARSPFWSPDGREVGFFVGDQLKRLALDATAARSVAPAPRAMGGAWGADGVIVFGTAQGPIYRVAAGGGGTAEPITEVEKGVEEMHVWPSFLPDGRRFVFLSDASTDEGHRVHLADIGGGPSRILLKGVRSSVQVDAAGSLLLVRDNQLLAYPFDLDSGQITGDPALIVDGITPIGSQHLAPFSVSRDGRLAWQHGSRLATFLRVDMSGRVVERLIKPARVANGVVSPDGTRLAFEIYSDQDFRPVEFYDLARGVGTPVSQTDARADSATWSADGATLYFDAHVGGSWAVYRNRVDGGAEPESLGCPEDATDCGSLDASADGRWLLANALMSERRSDLFLYSLEPGATGWTPWLATAAAEGHASFSPDSRLIAYTSDVSGRAEAYVAPLEGGPASRRWQVSTNGGSEPRFGPDGKRLYYRAANDTLMVVDVDATGERFVASAPRPLYELKLPVLPYERNTFDVDPDGKSLVVIQSLEGDEAAIYVRTAWRPRS